MNDSLRQQVWTRAHDACEYCQMPDRADRLQFGIDHIRPQYHGGPTHRDNLALACFNCNTFKGTNIAGYDPETGTLTRLFHPRQDSWREHFEWNRAVLKGKTPIGRTTVKVLRINIATRVEQRRLLIEAGMFVGGA